MGKVMKKIIFVLPLCLIASVGLSQQPLTINQDPSNEKLKNEICESNLRMAKNIMTARQTGIPIERTLELTTDKDDKIICLIKSIVA